MASAPDPVTPGRVIGGKYRLDRRVAEGGMGTVWVARHQVLDVDVAVKIMFGSIAGTDLALARFEREAKASAQLKSHHIVRVFDYGVDEGTPFMVMDLLEGEDMGQRLKRTGPITPAELAPLFSQICKGLEVAHAAGIVHRDLKPSNVFLAREGGEEVVKLVDFGVARETKTSLVEEKTTSGTVVGSPHHMSPEQARGENVDQRSDLWALGVVAYRALTGQKPFEGEVITAVLLDVVSKPIPRATLANPELPEGVDRFMEKALCRSVDRRFQSARAMAEAMTAIAQGKDIAPYLADVETEGREEPTMPSAERVSVTSLEVSPEMSTDRTVSRVMTAVTSGTTSRRASRGWPWIAVGAALLLLAFYLGRFAQEAPEPAASPPTRTLTERAPEPTPMVVPTAAPVSSPVPTSTAATSTTVRTRPRLPMASSKPHPPSKPKIDPFTGLPTP